MPRIKKPEMRSKLEISWPELTDGGRGGEGKMAELSTVQVWQNYSDLYNVVPNWHFQLRANQEKFIAKSFGRNERLTRELVKTFDLSMNFEVCLNSSASLTELEDRNVSGIYSKEILNSVTDVSWTFLGYICIYLLSTVLLKTDKIDFFSYYRSRSYTHTNLYFLCSSLR